MIKLSDSLAAWNSADFVKVFKSEVAMLTLVDLEPEQSVAEALAAAGLQPRVRETGTGLPGLIDAWYVNASTTGSSAMPEPTTENAFTRVSACAPDGLVARTGLA